VKPKKLHHFNNIIYIWFSLSGNPEGITHELGDYLDILGDLSAFLAILLGGGGG
jgi:hypothetical protein